jgi:hypothetical protein
MRVGAEFQTYNLVGSFSLTGHHDAGRHVSLANFAKNVEAIVGPEEKIQHDEIELVLGESLERGLCIGRFRHDHAVRAQI